MLMTPLEHKDDISGSFTSGSNSKLLGWDGTLTSLAKVNGTSKYSVQALTNSMSIYIKKHKQVICQYAILRKLDLEP